MSVVFFKIMRIVIEWSGFQHIGMKNASATAKSALTSFVVLVASELLRFIELET